MMFFSAIETKDIVAGLLVLFLLFGKVGGKSLLSINTEQEIELGKEVSAQVEKQYGVVKDPKYEDIVQQIGKKIAEVAPRKDVQYNYTVLKSDDVNAMAAPGGFVFVNKGLLDYINFDKDILAFVIGHEVGHIVARHAAKMIEKELKTEIAITVISKSETQAKMLSLARDLVFLGYGRDNEFEADRWGVILAYKAGYNPNGAVEFFKKLMKDEKGKPSKLAVFFSTHPPTQDRLNRVEEEIRRLEQNAHN
ncbi:M48 family metalloprotease [bacterium]|nr:M48 family metalloprotease [bacterium]